MTSTQQNLRIPTKKSRRGRIAVPAGQRRSDTPPEIPTTAKASPGPRISALDAAVGVLCRLSSKEAESGLGVKELIDRMAKAGLWKSASGKTPSATLYSALIREIKQRRTDSRFKRIAPGKFSLAEGGGTARKPRAKSGTESVR